MATIEAISRRVIEEKLQNVLQLTPDCAASLLKASGLGDHIQFLPLHGPTSLEALRSSAAADERNVDDLRREDDARKKEFVQNGAILFYFETNKLMRLVQSSSRLVARKLQRALMGLLEPPGMDQRDFDPVCLGHLERWDVEEVCGFASLLGLDPQPFRALPVAGEDLKFIDSDDEFAELNIDPGP